MSTKPTSVEEYFANLPDDQRAILEQVRTAIRELAPDAVESISYDLPTYKLHGKPLAYFGAAKKHWALYGMVHEEEKTERLAEYDVAKGTIRFPWDKPVPVDLVKELVGVRLAALEAAAGSKRRPAKDSKA
jgi:uncharacterized protein YdhG (YjbR/CyaY superfamily)